MLFRRNAKRLQKLTEDILDVTKIESQSLKFDKEQFELNEIITNAISDCKKKLTIEPHKEKDVKIVLLSLYEKICIEGDKNRLTRVISNVLINVQNFTEKWAISISISMKIKRGDAENNNNHYRIAKIRVLLRNINKGLTSNARPKQSYNSALDYKS
jgi:K+-sensing histidine kinase KdpD